jgi:FKBP-type peptidyl-prolyl cis-trans isomerase 2
VAPGYLGRMSDLWSFRDNVGADRADLDGMTVEAVDGSVGSVQDVISDVDGAYLLVDTGPPLLGKTVLVPAGLVKAIDVGNESLAVDRTKDEIKGAPDFDAGLGKDPDYRAAIARHYGA